MIANSILLLLSLGCSRQSVQVATLPTPIERRAKVVSGVIAGSLNLSVNSDIQQKDYVAKNGFAGTAVYILNTPAEYVSPQRSPMVLHDEGGVISPTYSCVQVGQHLVVTWKQGDSHDIFVGGRKNVQPGRTVRADPDYFYTTLWQPEEGVGVSCPYHVAEVAFVTVVPNQFHTLSAADGSFQLHYTLPAGPYVLRAYHPRLGNAEKNVKIESEKVLVNMQLRRPSKQ